MNTRSSPANLNDKPFPDISWKAARDYAYILLGGLIQALAMRLFLVPAQIVSGGISGAAQIINFFSGWPIGVMTLLGNAPLFILGWRFLGGRRFATRTAFAVVAFSLFTDLLVPFLPANGVTDDMVLNTLFGGLVLGVGLGLTYRGQGTSGGSDILARILNFRLHMSISQAYLLTDALVVLAAGFAFDWTHALYGLVLIYVSGVAAEMASEGTDILRTALIVTTCGDEVASQIMTLMERGVTVLPATGAYTGQERQMLYCVVSRAEVNQLKAVVRETDPKAFMVIGQAHEALGEGFKPLSH